MKKFRLLSSTEQKFVGVKQRRIQEDMRRVGGNVQRSGDDPFGNGFGNASVFWFLGYNNIIGKPKKKNAFFV